MQNEKSKTTFEELPLGHAVLCKYAGTEWSEIVLITKIALSKTGKAAFILRQTNYCGGKQPGLDTHTTTGWCDLKDLSKKYEIFDEL